MEESSRVSHSESESIRKTLVGEGGVACRADDGSCKVSFTSSSSASSKSRVQGPGPRNPEAASPWSSCVCFV